MWRLAYRRKLTFRIAVAKAAKIAYAGGMTKLTLTADIENLKDLVVPTDVGLATLTRYDIPALASLEIVSYGEDETALNLVETSEQIRMTMDGAYGTPRDDSMIGAWADGELVGAVFCVLDAPWDDVPRGPFVLELMVDPSYQRRGIATALLLELATRAGTWGYDSVTLNLDMRRSPSALSLYQGLGFEEV